MGIKVAINGFGRIGRLLFRVLSSRGSAFDVVAINDLSDAASLAHILKYDSVHRQFPGEVGHEGTNLIVNGRKIPILAVRAPKELPWKDLGVEIACECTGFFTEKSSPKGGYGDHLAAGAKKVLLSAPAKDKIDATIVMGVNHGQLKAEHKTFSNASCTTNCTAPLLKVIHEKFGLVKGMITTIHAYTNDQRIADMIHSDLRRARAAAVNIIPTTTGMSKAIGAVIPDLMGKVEGLSFRVPVPDGSLIDCSLELSKDVTADEVKGALKAASEGPLKGILGYTEDPIVSSDILGNTNSSIVDASLTAVLDKRILKVVSWYDNECGFSNRMADLMELAHKLG
ncbi:MAG: type I glyceraldehyde-3-phosphate dehydrogenase [Planctomycetota bacterium]|nr:type I glyceraldehyde-3-phosphate dehydrogenase [Planctomycetota bacterium]